MTHYGIRTLTTLPSDARWASVPMGGVTKWVANDREALRADTMTRMLLYALVFLDLDPAKFTIEALPAIVAVPALRRLS